MKYIVKVNNISNGTTYESREYEFDNEEKAQHEFHWYLEYSTAESVELVAIK